MRANDHKEGWEHEMPQWLIERAREEVRELDDAVDAVRARGVGDGRDEGVWWEAADVAVFAMMAAEVSTESVYPDRGGSR